MRLAEGGRACLVVLNDLDLQSLILFSTMFLFSFWLNSAGSHGSHELYLLNIRQGRLMDHGRMVKQSF